MINSVELYLTELKKELAGSDRATIQDALSDAEEYLRNALKSTGPNAAPADTLAQIIKKYGTPAEVAAAYKELESRTPPPYTPPIPQKTTASAVPAKPPAMPDTRSWPLRFFGVYTEPRAWGSLFYLIFSLATGIIYFTWAVTGLSLSGGLLVLIIGLAFCGLFLLSIRGIALLEGRLVEALLGVRMPHRPLFSRRDIGWWQKFKSMLASRYTWTALVYMIIQMPLGIIYFTVTITLISVSLWLIGSPIWQLAADLPLFVIYPYEYYTATWALPLLVIGGVLLLTATMHLAKITGKGHGHLAKALLVAE